MTGQSIAVETCTFAEWAYFERICRGVGVLYFVVDHERHVHFPRTHDAQRAPAACLHRRVDCGACAVDTVVCAGVRTTTAAHADQGHIACRAASSGTRSACAGNDAAACACCCRQVTVSGTQTAFGKYASQIRIRAGGRDRGGCRTGCRGASAFLSDCAGYRPGGCALRNEEQCSSSRLERHAKGTGCDYAVISGGV